MKCTQFFLIKISIFLFLISLSMSMLAQRNTSSRPSRPSQQSSLSLQEKARNEQVKAEISAYLLKAILHTKDPQAYPISRGELSGRFVPIIKYLSAERRLEVQNKALNAYKNPNLIRKYLGSYSGRLDLRKNLQAQFGSKALLSHTSKKSVVPKMSKPYEDPGKDSECQLPDGSLRLNLKAVHMLKETYGAFETKAGEDDIFLSLVLTGPDKSAISVGPMFIGIFDGPVNSTSSYKTFSPNKELYKFITKSHGETQNFTATFLLIEHDGQGSYPDVKKVMDEIASVLDDFAYGIPSIVVDIIDVIANIFMEDDYFRPETTSFGITTKTNSQVFNTSKTTVGHGGKYKISFKWDYRKPKPDQIKIAKCYQGDDGTIYYFRPDGNNQFVAFGEHPNGSGSSVLRGSLTPDGKMTGQWASVPKGKLKSSGLISLEADPYCAGDILQVTSATGEFPTHKLNAIPYPINAINKMPQGFKGNFKNLSGRWKGSDNATYYLTHFQNGSVWLFGEKDFNNGAPLYAHVGFGKVEGNELKLDIRTLGKGQKAGNGPVVFQINPYNLVKKSGGLTMASQNISRTPPKLRPSFVKYSAEQLSVKESALRNSQAAYKIFRGGNAIYHYTSKELAEEILAFMKSNQLDNFTKIGSGKMGTQFFFKGGSVPELDVAGIWQAAQLEYQAITARAIKRSYVRGVYYLSFGTGKIPFKTEEQMNTAKYLIEKHKLSQRCVVSLGGETFEYWK